MRLFPRLAPLFVSASGVLLASLTSLALAGCGSDAQIASSGAGDSYTGGDTDNTGGGGVGGSGGSAAGGNGGTAGNGGTGGNGGLDPSGLGDNGAWCKPIPACDAAPPAIEQLPWKHDIVSPTVAAGTPGHRGRDLFLNPADPQWIIGKFAYSFVPVEVDKDLKDEQVDLYLLRNCEGEWEHLGSAVTTDDDEHAEVEGVADSGGRIYFQIPADRALELGRHRVHMVVRGDLTSADLFIEVVPPQTPVFVSDVDGTLTSYESEEFVALLSGALPVMNPDASAALQLLAAKGYHPFYLTARPEFLVYRTREFLAANGFPPGIVHTTLSLTGATGSSAETYKTGELEALAERGLAPDYGFGNTASDAAAYDAIDIQPESARILFQFDDPSGAGRRIESYTELLQQFEALPDLCQ